MTDRQVPVVLADAVSEEEARSRYAPFAVPAPGVPLFQAAVADLDPWTQDEVDTAAAGRGHAADRLR
ncbi:hypothetical protein ACWD00_00990 [Streptomyces viridiviolaceus]